MNTGVSFIKNKTLFNLGFFLTFFLYVIGNDYLGGDFATISMVFGGLTSILFILSARNIRIQPVIAALILIFSYIVIQLSLSQGVFGFLLVIISFCFGSMIANKIIEVKTASLLLIILYLTIFYKAFILGMDVNEVVDGGSRNVISIDVIVLLTTYYLVTYICKRPLFFKLWPACIGFILCLVAVGRSGVIFSAMLLCIVFIYNLTNYKISSINKILLVVASLTVGYIFFHFFIFKDNYILDMENYSHMGDDIRFVFLYEFFMSYRLENLFIGYDLRNLDVLHNFNANSHNSYIAFLSLAGIGALLFLLIFLMKLISLVRHRMWFLAFIIVPVLGRFASDTGLFFSIHDTLLFAILSVGYTTHKSAIKVAEPMTEGSKRTYA